MTDVAATASESAGGERETTGVQSRPLGRRPYWPVAAVLAVGLLVTAVLAVVSFALNRANERHLLALRAKEVGSALTAALPETQTPLGAAAALGQATNGDPVKFRRFASMYVGARRPFVSLSLWRPHDISAGPVVVAGARPRLRPSTARASRFLSTAAAGAGLSVIGLLQGPAPRLGYGYSGSGARAYVAYGEAALAASRYTQLPPGSAYSNLNVALYLGRSTRPAALLLRTVRQLPLPGRQIRSSIPFGDTTLTLLVSASQPLGGTLPQAVVWGIVIAGVLLTLAAAFLIARLITGRRRAQGLAEENARLYAEQRTIAQTLQHSLLPDVLPRMGGIEVAARYEAGVSGIDVGGDWYDAIELADRRMLLVIGDVSGRGLKAATAMASLRFAIQYAAQESEPARFLAQLSSTHRATLAGQFATVLCVCIDLPARKVTVTSAGHLPPLLLDEGRGTFLYTEVGPPVGIEDDARYVSSTFPLPAAAMLLGYTDGLVERRGEALDDGLERLQCAAEDASDGRSEGAVGLDELLARLLATVRDDSSADDTAVAGVRWVS